MADAAEFRSGTVYVVDDDYDVRESLCMLLRSLGMRAAAFASAGEFLGAAGPDPEGCLVADVRMPGMSGLELQQELARRGIPLPVIVITGHGDVPTAVTAMKGGAVDFLQKPFSDQALLDRVHGALRLYAAGRARRALAEELSARLAGLTPREREVLQRVAAGKPNKIIARELGLSTRTVEIHRARVMKKMRARSLADLVRMTDAAGDPAEKR